MKNLGSLCLVALLVSTTAQGATHSAARRPGESFRDARARALGDQRAFSAGSADEVAVPMDQLEQGSAVPWDHLGSFDAVTHAFEQVRDVRFMSSWIKRRFPRRITWLYPDDGCWARAATADLKYAELGYPMPSKVFAFGNLSVKTKNSPWGGVGWWYHVAPAVSYAGTAYVLDPAIEPKRPLTLADWIGLMSDDPKTVNVAICAPGTYGPGSDCATTHTRDNAHGPGEEKYYLFWEWIRLLILGRKPVQELGEHPPW